MSSGVAVLGRVGVLCAPKFGALMRDTLRPDALPASPVGAPRGCGQASRSARDSRASCASHLASPRGLLAVPRWILSHVCGFRVSCCTSLSFVQCFAVYHVPCGLSSVAALRCICFFSARIACGSRKPCAPLVARHYSRIGSLVWILSVR